MRFDEFAELVEDTEWVVEGLLPYRQKGLIVGRPGSGKSWFLERLALDVASDQAFLGRYEIEKPGPVLLVDQDSPREVVRERILALASGQGIPSDLYIESQAGHALDLRQGVEELSALVAKVEPVLVILETLDTLTSGNFDENRVQDMRPFFKALGRLQDAHPCTILLSHHFSKRGQAKDPITFVRGSSALPASVDVAYGVERISGQKDAPVFLVQPFPKRVKTVSGFQMELVTSDVDGKLDRAALRWLRDWDTDLDPELAEKRMLILELAIDRGKEGVTVQEVVTAGEAYISDREARALLDSLLDEGALVRGKEAHGRFRFWTPTTHPSVGSEGEPEGKREGTVEGGPEDESAGESGAEVEAPRSIDSAPEPPDEWSTAPGV